MQQDLKQNEIKRTMEKETKPNRKTKEKHTEVHGGCVLRGEATGVIF